MSRQLKRLITIFAAMIILSWFDINAASPIVHIAQKNESIYSIAHRYGYSVDEIVLMNPSLRNGIKPGARILIPRGDLSDSATNNQTVSTNSSSAIVYDNPSLPDSSSTLQPDTISADIFVSDNTLPELNISVLLPFQTNRETPTRQAQNYTDFIRGMLMGIDTLRNDTTLPHVTMRIFDTYENNDTVNSILSTPEVAGSDYIIVCDNSDNIESAANVADKSGAIVLNLFAVRNEAQLNHPSVVQTNIPHEEMYHNAVKRFISKYNGYIPVIIEEAQPSATPDKTKFTTLLTSQLSDAGIKYRTVRYADSLLADSLTWLDPDLNYVFIPSYSSRSTLSAILPAMLQARANSALGLGTVTLFGYPEWIIFPQDITRKLHELDATIYSRFGSNPNGYRTRTFASNFNSHYGCSMLSSAPSYALLGYDTAIWLIDTPNPLGQAFSGLQNSFYFNTPDVGDSNSRINNALYFITFQSTGLIDNSTDL